MDPFTCQHVVGISVRKLFTDIFMERLTHDIVACSRYQAFPPPPPQPLHTYPGLPSGVLGCPRLVLGYGMGVGFGFGVGDGGLGMS